MRIRYSVIHPSCFHPSKQENSPGIDIPVQQEITLPPNGQMTVDTGIQLVLPTNLCAQLIPHESSSRVNLYIHSGFVDSNFSSTIKLLLRNDSSTTVKIEPGTNLVQALILPILHPTLILESSVQSYSIKVEDSKGNDLPHKLESEDLSHSSLITSAHEKEGSAIALKNFHLCALPPSYIHMMTEEKVPSCMNILEINTNIILPNAKENRESIFNDLKEMESQNENAIKNDHLTPISFPNPNSEYLIQNLNRDLINQTVYLHSTVSTPQKDSKIEPKNNVYGIFGVKTYNVLMNKLKELGK
jgi:dUTPase